jgi:hypothetical protein
LAEHGMGGEGMNKPKPNKKTGEQFKAVLMTYYTRPMMWVYFAVYLFLNYITFTAESSNDLFEDFFWIYLIQGIIFGVVFSMIVVQLIGQFSLPASKLVPHYFTPHNITAGIILICSIPIMGVEAILFDIPLLMWIGSFCGLITCYCLIAIWTSDSILGAIWYIPFGISWLILVPVFIVKEFIPFITQFYYWFLDGYQILFPIPVALGLLTLWAYSEILKDLFNTRSDRGYQKALISMNDLEELSEIKHDKFSRDSEVNKLQEAAITQMSQLKWDLFDSQNRQILWRAGIIRHTVEFKLAIIMILITVTLNLLGFFLNQSPLWLIFYISLSMGFIFPLLSNAIENWSLQLKSMKLNILKPIPHKTIVYDVFRILFYDSLLSFLLLFSYVFIIAYSLSSEDQQFENFTVVLVFNILILFAFSIYLYIQSVQGFTIETDPKKIIKWIIVSGCFIVFCFIMNDLFDLIKSREPDSPTKIVFYAVFFFAAAMFVFYLTYRRWQNMEWGAKG